MLGAGLIGVAYLAVGLVPLATGQLELAPTEVDIHAIEKDGFPDATYLTISGGALVWPLARFDRQGGEVTRVVAPLASPEIATAWNPTGTNDGSALRVAVRFDAEQLEERWPGMLEVPTERLPALATTITGETVPLRFLVGNALPLLDDVDTDTARALYFERHSLWSSLRKLLFGGFLLAICLAMVVRQRRAPPGATTGRSEAAYAVATSAEILDDAVDDD